MAEEKKINIRIDADASGLNQKAREAKDNFRDAFEELSDYDILGDADKQFDKIEDKVNAIKDKMAEMRREMHDNIDTSRASNQFGRDKIKTEQGGKIDSKFEDLLKKFDRYISELNKQNSGRSGGTGWDAMKGYDKYADRMSPEQYMNFRNKQREGELSKMLSEGGESQSPQKSGLLARMFSRGIGGGGMQGAITEGVSGSGGMLSGAMGLGGGALLVGGAIAGVLIAGVSKAIADGMKMNREEAKSNALVNNQFSGFSGDYNDTATGMDNDELLQYGTRVARSRGLAGTSLAEDTRRRTYLQNAYSLQEGDVQGLDKFYRYQNNGSRKDSTEMIADILNRSEKQGILGVSGNDFSRLPEKIGVVSDLLGMQKNNSEQIDSNFAVNMALAGDKIGGRFGDDRLGESMGRIDGSIKNPGNSGMRAYIYQMLQKANPNASYTDIMAKMEDGASGDNLKAILPQIAQMQQGEMRRMILFQLTRNMQDAIRLDAGGNLNEMLKATQNMGGSSKGEIDSRFDAIKGRASDNQTRIDQITTGISQWWDKASGEFTKFLGLSTDAQNAEYDGKRGAILSGALFTPTPVIGQTLYNYFFNDTK